MQIPFARWFRSTRADTGDGPAVDPEVRNEAELRDLLQKLEKEAEEAIPGYRGTALNRAGDVCFRAGQREQALSYYGQAIDAYLEEEQPESARGVARKIIRLHPAAVRTLCTLTWLDLAAGHRGDALAHLSRYVDAAARAGREDLAVEQVVEMARAAPDAEFRGAAAEALSQLGALRAASEVRGWGSDDRTLAPEDLATHCFAAAVGSNERRRQEGAVA